MRTVPGHKNVATVADRGGENGLIFRGQIERAYGGEVGDLKGCDRQLSSDRGKSRQAWRELGRQVSAGLLHHVPIDPQLMAQRVKPREQRSCGAVRFSGGEQDVGIKEDAHRKVRIQRRALAFGNLAASFASSSSNSRICAGV